VVVVHVGVMHVEKVSEYLDDLFIDHNVSLCPLLVLERRIGLGTMPDREEAVVGIEVFDVKTAEGS